MAGIDARNNFKGHRVHEPYKLYSFYNIYFISEVISEQK